MVAAFKYDQLGELTFKEQELTLLELTFKEDQKHEHIPGPELTFKEQELTFLVAAFLPGILELTLIGTNL